ncbi:MAG: hypothetical protein ABI251_01970, partial [Mycobacteriaceae bacterium]
WAPVNAAAIGVHAIGGLGLILANRRRIGKQQGVGANTGVKAALTVIAAGATAYSGVLGAKVAEGGRSHAEAATTPSNHTPPEVAKAQQQLSVVQWAIPVLTGIVMILGAQQGEQQRPSQVLRGLANKVS